MQNGKCYICGSNDYGKRRTRLAVDHCHVTGKIRKLLCPPCNTGLEGFKDNINVMGKAISYLREHTRS